MWVWVGVCVGGGGGGGGGGGMFPAVTLDPLGKKLTCAIDIPNLTMTKSQTSESCHFKMKRNIHPNQGILTIMIDVVLTGLRYV